MRTEGNSKTSAISDFETIHPSNKKISHLAEPRNRFSEALEGNERSRAGRSWPEPAGAGPEERSGGFSQILEENNFEKRFWEDFGRFWEGFACQIPGPSQPALQNLLEFIGFSWIFIKMLDF